MPGNTPGIPYSASNYALCFKCHSERSLRNYVIFEKHKTHIDIVSCARCHDPHGVPNGTTLANAFLINFDLNIVASGSNGRLEFRHAGFRQGSCSLCCHGENHNPKTYGPGN